MSHDTPEELLPPFWIEICRQPGLWIDDADDESFAVVEDALLHLAAGRLFPRRCTTMAKLRTKGQQYEPLTRNAQSTDTLATPPSPEAVEAQRALLKRSESERVSLAGVSPADALRALLKTPPDETDIHTH